MQGGSDYFDPMSGRLRQVSLTIGSGQTNANNQSQSVTPGKPHFSTLQYKDSDHIHPLNQSAHDSLALNLGYSQIMKTTRTEPYLMHQNVVHSHTLNRPSKRQLGNQAWSQSQTLMRPSQGLRQSPWMMFKGEFGTCNIEQNPVIAVYGNVSSNKTEPQKQGMQYQGEAEAAGVTCLYGNGDERMNGASVDHITLNGLYEDDGQMKAEPQRLCMQHQEKAVSASMDCLHDDGDRRLHVGSSDPNPVNGLYDGLIVPDAQSSWMMNQDGVDTGHNEVNSVYGNEDAELPTVTDSRIYGNL